MVTTYFDISIETLEIYAQYDDVKGVYPWEATGPWNRIQQFQPFPEVVNCIETVSYTHLCFFRGNDKK